MAISRMTDQIGRVVSGRYRLLAPIGAGASAEVFLAEDVRLKRRVAVKVLHAALADDDQFLRRFRREAQAAAALNHPHIVAVYDWGEDDLPYLVTEYLGGGSLRSILDQGTRLNPSQALMVGLEATRGLDYAHRRGFVHRDIKPANLLFGDDRRLRIADFGLARALAEAAWTEPSGAVLGTARYASPEQAQGRSVDGRSDVYSLGLSLVEAVTGAVPFAADTTIGTLMARVDTSPDLPESLGALRKPLLRAGDPDPDLRPDAGEFGVSLMAAAELLDRPEPLPLAPPVTEGPEAEALPTGEPTMISTAESDTDDDTTVEVVDDATDEPDEPRRRRWPLRVAFALIALALGAAGAYALVQAQVPSHDVPTLEGMQEIDAREQIDDFGWRIETREDRQDGTEPGEVLRTEPTAGSSLKEGETLILVVSKGNSLVSVPAADSLVGMTRADAEATLSEVDLVAVFEERFDEQVPADEVMAVAEDLPEELPKGSEVPLVVSAGPEPRTIPDDLAGGSFEEAEAALAEVQLVAERRNVFSDDVPKGQVVRTSPAGGTEAPRDSTVVVEVSQGPEFVAVPDVKGLTEEEAIAAIEAAGLVYGESFGRPNGSPDSTDPEAGTEVRQGTRVDIFLKR